MIVGLPIWDKKGNYITSFNTDYYNFVITAKNNQVKGCLKTNCVFNPGEYISVVAIVDGREFLYRSTNKNFIVANKERVFGFTSLPHQWEIYE